MILMFSPSLARRALNAARGRLLRMANLSWWLSFEHGRDARALVLPRSARRVGRLPLRQVSRENRVQHMRVELVLDLCREYMLSKFVCAGSGAFYAARR